MPVAPFADRAPLSPPRSKTPDPFVAPRHRTLTPELPDLAEAIPGQRMAPPAPRAPAPAAPTPWSPRRLHGPVPSAHPPALAAQKLAQLLGARPFPLGASGSQHALLDVLLMVQDVVLGERLRPFAPQTLLAGAAARYLALSDRVAEPAVWDVRMVVPEDASGRAAQAMAQIRRNGQKGRGRHLAAAVVAQGPLLTVTSRMGDTVLRVHLRDPSNLDAPDELACQQLLLCCQNRTWRATGGLSLFEAMALAASGQYRAPQVHLAEAHPLPQDVAGALESLLNTWRLQQAGYRPQALLDEADLAAVARLGNHLAQIQQRGQQAVIPAALRLVHHTIAPTWAPLKSAPMRAQLGLAATAWVFLSQWQRQAPDSVTLTPLIVCLRGLCASHMDRACGDARLAFAIAEGLCADAPTSALWRRLLVALPSGPGEGQHLEVVRDGGMLSVALPIWSTHLFVDAGAQQPGLRPVGGPKGQATLADLCAAGSCRTLGELLASALGCPSLAELVNYGATAVPKGRRCLAQAFTETLVAPDAPSGEACARLVYGAALLGGAQALMGLEQQVRATFSLQQMCDAWSVLPLTETDVHQEIKAALVALLQPHLEALAQIQAPMGAVRPTVHKLVQQLVRRGLHAEALALLETDPMLGGQVSGQQALALLVARCAKPLSPTLEAHLLAAVGRHRGASQALLRQEPALWRAWASRPSSSLSLANVLANVEAVAQEPLDHWLEAFHTAEDLAPLLQFITAVPPTHPALGEVLTRLCQCASTQGDGPALHLALQTLDAARHSLDPKVRAQVALPLVRILQSPTRAHQGALDISPDDRLLLAEDVLLGHSSPEARKLALAELGQLKDTFVAARALGLALAQCDMSTLMRLSSTDIRQLFAVVDTLTPDLMPKLTSDAADHLVNLLSRLETVSARDAATVAPLNVNALKFLVQRRHVEAGQKLLELQMRSPASVRLSLQAFRGPGVVDLGRAWRHFFDTCAQSIQARQDRKLLEHGSAPPAPRFVLATLVAQGLRAELRAFEQIPDHASNPGAQAVVLEAILYGLRRRHSFIRLLPDEPLLHEVAHFIARHDLGQKGLEGVHGFGTIEAEGDNRSSGSSSNDATPRASSSASSSVAEDAPLMDKPTAPGPVDAKAAQRLAQACQAQQSEFVDDNSVPLELWTVMHLGLAQRPAHDRQRLVHASFQHITGRSLAATMQSDADEKPLSHREAIIGSTWAGHLFCAPRPEQTAPPKLWSMLACAHLEDPSAVLRLTQLTLSMAEANIAAHPIRIATDSLLLPSDTPLDAAELQRRQVVSLHIAVAAVIVADTLAPHEFAEQISRLLDAQQKPLEGLSALPWLQVMDDLKHLPLSATTKLDHSIRAFEARCLAPGAHDALRQTLHLHALEQQLDAWLLRLHQGETSSQRHSLNGIFSLIPTFFEISSFTHDVSINHIFALLCCNPKVADLVREELLTAVYLRPESFDGPDPIKLIFDILFATDPRADRTLGHFLGMERLKQAKGMPLPSYWPDTRRFFIGQTSLDELRHAQTLSTTLAKLLASDDSNERRFAEQWAQGKDPKACSIVRLRRPPPPGQRRR